MTMNTRQDTLQAMATRFGASGQLGVISHLRSVLGAPSRPERLALCIAGVDRFEAINGAFGRDVGDRVMHEIAKRLRMAAPSLIQAVIRLDGDRFAVVLPGFNRVDEAESIVARALDYVRRPISMDGVSIHVTASAGLVECALTGQTDPVDLVNAAESALMWAKSDGRDRYRVFTPTREASERRRHELSSALPSAIDAGEIIVFFHQLMNLDSRRSTIVGFEALARWSHPTLGMIGPDQFIGLAVNLGLINALGSHVLRQACRHAATWVELNGVRPYVSVNVAAEQLADPSFVDVVWDALDEAGLPANRLHLEITESSVIQTDDRTLATLRLLHRGGVSLVLDDFGTGYSNLNVLPKLPLSGLKLDCGFIGQLANEAQRPFLRNVVSIGQTLNLRVTAEGIEQQEQADAMRKLGCHIGQGFLFGEPMSADDVKAAIRRAQRPVRDVRGHRRADRVRRGVLSLEGLLRGA